MRFRVSILLMLAVVSACSTTDNADTDAGVDAGGEMDLGATDMSEMDASARDAEALDAGTGADAHFNTCSPPGSCDVLSGAACLESERCSFGDFADAGVVTAQCEMLETVGHEGDTCFSRNECASGLYCAFGAYVCLPLCCPVNGDADCPAGRRCDYLFDSDDQYSMRGCSPDFECDLVLQTGCGEGESCILLTDPLPVVRGCAPSGSVPEGEICDPLLDECALGLDCTNLLDPMHTRCTRYCSTTTSSACGAGQACNPTGLEGTGYGVCRTPS